MLCVDVGDVLVVTLYEYFTTVNDVVEESTNLSCKEFLFTDSVFELGFVEFLGKGADNLFCTIVFLC